MPSALDKRIIEAAKFYKQGRADIALAIMRDIARQDPDNVVAWWGLSTMTADEDEKLTALQTVLQLDPENERARNALARLTSHTPGSDGDQPHIEPTRGVIPTPPLLPTSADPDSSDAVAATSPDPADLPRPPVAEPPAESAEPIVHRPAITAPTPPPLPAPPPAPVALVEWQPAPSALPTVQVDRWYRLLGILGCALLLLSLFVPFAEFEFYFVQNSPTGTQTFSAYHELTGLQGLGAMWFEAEYVVAEAYITIDRDHLAEDGILIALPLYVAPLLLFLVLRGPVFTGFRRFSALLALALAGGLLYLMEAEGTLQTPLAGFVLHLAGCGLWLVAGLAPVRRREAPVSIAQLVGDQVAAGNAMSDAAPWFQGSYATVRVVGLIGSLLLAASVVALRLVYDGWWMLEYVYPFYEFVYLYESEKLSLLAALYGLPTLGFLVVRARSLDLFRRLNLLLVAAIVGAAGYALADRYTTYDELLLVDWPLYYGLLGGGLLFWLIAGLAVHGEEFVDDLMPVVDSPVPPAGVALASPVATAPELNGRSVVLWVQSRSRGWRVTGSTQDTVYIEKQVGISTLLGVTLMVLLPLVGVLIVWAWIWAAGTRRFAVYDRAEGVDIIGENFQMNIHQPADIAYFIQAVPTRLTIGPALLAGVVAVVADVVLWQLIVGV